MYLSFYLGVPCHSTVYGCCPDNVTVRLDKGLDSCVTICVQGDCTTDVPAGSSHQSIHHLSLHPSIHHHTSNGHNLIFTFTFSNIFFGIDVKINFYMYFLHFPTSFSSYLFTLRSGIRLQNRGPN